MAPRRSRTLTLVEDFRGPGKNGTNVGRNGAQSFDASVSSKLKIAFWCGEDFFNFFVFIPILLNMFHIAEKKTPPPPQTICSASTFFFRLFLSFGNNFPVLGNRKNKRVTATSAFDHQEVIRLQTLSFEPVRDSLMMIRSFLLLSVQLVLPPYSVQI